ncbi:Serine/threonine-protein kinase ulk2 [Physocladia obscura]|uniref:Serine/threonine-protein kinase ulk2 n=1 Tax=Physocladia obscura TaxID=109957 RepID=A0AAD5SQ30_9FUNG|nr:Serine/threonine-protein kinase ulk2 [Physocladia obscura]
MENEEQVCGEIFNMMTDSHRTVSSSRTNSNSSTGQSGHDFDNSTESLSPRVYGDLSSEQTARIAIFEAFKNSPAKFLTKYTVDRVIGFGSNGVVLAAISNSQSLPVAIKIIYKNHSSSKLSSTHIPHEVKILKTLSKKVASTTNTVSSLLKYIEHWHDKNHFYLVTELFGSDWLSNAASAEQLNPISFYVRYNSTTLRRVNLPFSSGSSDLWAWAYTHRAHAWELSQFQNTKLPIRQVRQIIQRVAMALAEVHARGFYHGDIKLENILVEAVVPDCFGAKSPEIRLADFGHARRVASGIRHYGTQDISPPELLRDSPYDAAKCDGRASDVFALGMMMYILVNDSGDLPKMAQAIKAGTIGYDELVAVDSGFYPMNGLEDIDVCGQELLDGMCMVDPKRRLTVEQIIAHSWFSEL